MLTGSLPEGREVPSELVKGLPPALDRIFERCYCRLEARYPHAGAVLRDLATLEGERAGALAAAPAHIELIGSGERRLLGEGANIVGSSRRANVRVCGRAVAPEHVVIEPAAGGGWQVRRADRGRPVWLLPAQLPPGRSEADLAVRLGQAPLTLGEGVTIVLGERDDPAALRLRFHDGAAALAGEPAPGEAGGGLLSVFEEEGSTFAFWGGLIAFAVALFVLARFGMSAWAFFGAMVVGFGVSAVLSERGARRAAHWARAHDAGQRAPRARRVCASVALRALAWFVDSALLVLLFGVWWTPLGWFAYDWFTTGIFGATAGKWLLGMEVVDLEGRRVGVLRAGVRTIGKVLSSLPFGFGYVLAAVTVSRQTFHDFLAETLVVRRD